MKRSNLKRRKNRMEGERKKREKRERERVKEREEKFSQQNAPYGDEYRHGRTDSNAIFTGPIWGEHYTLICNEFHSNNEFYGQKTVNFLILVFALCNRRAAGFFCCKLVPLRNNFVFFLSKIQMGRKFSFFFYLAQVPV